VLGVIGCITVERIDEKKDDDEKTFAFPDIRPGSPWPAPDPPAKPDGWHATDPTIQPENINPPVGGPSPWIQN
jgi:hypothetical protein